MFKRRTPRTRGEKFREFMWPSMGIKRLGLYYKHRMGRLPGTPQFIAKGMASGVAISFTPFVGLHMIMGTIACWLTRGSLLSMVLGSLLGGNLWTLPLIWVATFKLGRFMMGHKHWDSVGPVTQGDLAVDKFSLQMLVDHPGRLLLPMTLGCLPMVFIAWIGTYYLTLEIVQKYQAARKHRIEKRRHHQAQKEHT
jgi:uncharacterized protein (DUF2062 family)